jgi:alkyl hydroperoxide reductase subunit AhpF
MFNAAQLEKACRMLDAMERPLQIRLNPGADSADKFSRALCRVVEQLVLSAPDKLTVVDLAPVDRPHLDVENVRYRAVPFGPELEPFLALLVALSGPESRLAPEQLAPAALQVMMAPTCPNCPRVVTVCGRVAAAHAQVQLEVVDVQYFADLAGAVKSVPTVIVDSTRSLVGNLSEQALLEVLAERTSGDYVKKTLASMIETGRFGDAVSLLVSPPGQVALAAMLASSTMPERIGLMLATEEALEANDRCLDGAVVHVLPLLKAPDANLRGDVADLLGKIGSPVARTGLEGLGSDPNPDVREIAADALDMLRKPS